MKTFKKTILTLFFTGILLLSYSFFIERNWIKINEYTISASFEYKIALISDLHLGKWKDEKFLEKVVNKINTQVSENSVEAVFIAGDFTYHPEKISDLSRLFQPLSEISVPVYAVLGNHDEEKPGPKLADELKQVLQANNVQIIEGKSFLIPNTTQKIRVIGLGDNWAHKDDVTPFLSEFSEHEKNQENFLVLTHNPDTSFYFPENSTAIALTGHTHGGQIRIPWLYKKMIPTSGNFDSGLLKTKKGQVFTTSGLGEVGLPLRFFIPPEIAVITFGKNQLNW